MSKELEALKHIVSEINNYKLHGIGDENWLGIQDVLKDVNILEKALTPPTEQEVCEALSEYFKKEIQYDNGDFYYQHMITKPKQYITRRSILAFSKRVVYHFDIQLPLRLITMLSRFYEGGKK